MKIFSRICSDFRRRGFTLIELLTVIAIIGILASIVVVSVTTARTKARDARRIADIGAIRTALEMYADTNNRYPVTSQWQSSTQAQPWISDISDPSIPLTPDFISVLPVDPRNISTPWNSGMFYLYQSDGQDYKLMSANPESAEGIKRAENDGGPIKRNTCPYDPNVSGITCAYELFTPGAQSW